VKYYSELSFLLLLVTMLLWLHPPHVPPKWRTPFLLFKAAVGAAAIAASVYMVVNAYATH